MDTVQFLCGNCNKPIAVSLAHLGGKVQCPHCTAVIQTPSQLPGPVPEVPNLELPGRTSPQAASPQAASPQAASPQADDAEPDSIFSPPPRRDALFDHEPAGPLVQMPEFQGSAPAAATLTDDAPADAADIRGEFPRVRPQAPQAGQGLLMVLIFLVPYALLTTLFVIYLLAFSPKPIHPLEMLPDPKPEKGGARPAALRVRHDHTMAAHLITNLKEPLQVGSLEVTPLKVKKGPGNLTLVLRAKNLSADTAFEPIHDSFLLARPMEPYTFLESSRYRPLYGGTLEYLQGPIGQEQTVRNGELRPGQEETIVLTTEERDREMVSKISSSSAPLTWRVQMRRGFVEVRGRKISATAVIGVRFTPSEMEPETL